MCADYEMNKWLAIAVSVISVSAVGAFAIYTYGWKDDASEPDAPVAVEADATGHHEITDRPRDWPPNPAGATSFHRPWPYIPGRPCPSLAPRHRAYVNQCSS